MPTMNNSSRVQLGDFTIIKKIGEGGMGTVYQARTVALKILPRLLSEKPEFVERFRREARAAASLVHPNVVQIYHVGEERGVHYFAMEYVEGQSLEALAAEGRRFEVDEALDIVMHVARALEAAAEKGIVHRDIKPANVMIDRKGVVKVMDFGLAKPTGEVNNITQPGLVIGTPSYMSPEQGEGSDVDCRSDIYSLGMVLYKLLAGAVPFTGDNPGTVIYKHLHEVPKAPSTVNPKVPAKVDALILKCLAKKPDDRFSTPAELLAAVARIRSGESQTDPTLMMGGAARSNADVTMPLPAHARGELTPPTLSPSAITGQTPSPGTGPYPPVGTGGYQPIEAGSGRWVMVAVAGLVLVATGLGFGAAFYLKGDKDTSNTVQPVPPGSDPTSKPPDRQDPGPDARPGETCTLRLAELSARIPRDAKVTLLPPAGREHQATGANLRNLPNLLGGRYTLRIEHRGYKLLETELQLSATGVAPALDSIKLAPTEALDKAYRRAEELLEGKPGYKEASDAQTELQKVGDLDPEYRKTAVLTDLAKNIIASEKKLCDTAFTDADKRFTDRQWEEASKGFASVPAWHDRYVYARDMKTKADANAAKVKAALAGLRDNVNHGRFGDATANLDVLDQLGSPKRESAVDELSKTLDAARKSWDEAENDFGRAQYADAKKKYLRVGELCPNYRKALEQADECERRITLAASANKELLEAQALFDKGKYTECLAALAKVKPTLSADNLKGHDALRSQAETRQEQDRVDKQLAAFNDAFRKGDVEGLTRVMDRVNKEGQDLAISFERDARDFFSSGLAVAASRHEFAEFKITERGSDGLPSQAQANVDWRFTLNLAEAGKTVTGKLPQVMHLNCVRGIWLLSRLAPNGKIELAAAASERPAPAGQVSGRVREVEGDAVTLDCGTDRGAAVKMVFDIFADAKVVKLPFSGDETIFVQESPVATVEVVRAERESSRAAFLPTIPAEARAKVKKGMLVLSSPVRHGLLKTPVITGHKVEPGEAQAAAGRQLAISVEAPAIEGGFLTYQWSADGGALSAVRTAEPRISWTAPAEAKAFKITVTAVSSLGDKSNPHTVEIQSSGPAVQTPAGYDLVGRICAPDLLKQAQDVAFDERGRACVLDSGMKRVLVLDPELRVVAISGRWPTEFSRIAMHGDVLYCLDPDSCAVKRFSLAAADPFTKPLAPDIGSRGQGNGRFRKPLDLAVSPSGEIHVLDFQDEASSVQVFSPEGTFLSSFGHGGSGNGALRDPVAIDVDVAGRVFVLDAAAHKVVVFRSGRPAGAFTCSDKTGKPVDLACDASSDSVLVLDAGFKQIATFAVKETEAFAVRGDRRADRSLGLTKAGPGELSAPTRLAVSRAGEALAVSGDGKHLDRFAVTGEFLGRLGGELFSESTRLACAPSGELLALDCDSGLVRRVSARGWVLAEFGGGKTFDKPIDLACDEGGTVYALDAGTHSVLAFDPAGKLLGKVGKKERPPAGLTDAMALAALRIDFVAVACDWKEKAFVRANVDKKELAGMPLTTANPRFVAVDAAETVYAAGSSGLVERCIKDGTRNTWTVKFKELAGIEASGQRLFALDVKEKAVLFCNPQTGEVLARTAQFPADCTKPRDLAANGYEELFVFDAKTQSVLVFRVKR
jgi:predicted Ser/Thr protein kinase/DNA-binding beta-propeller fold protein YncE